MQLSSFKRISHVISVLHKHKLGKLLIRLGFGHHLPLLKRFQAGKTPLPADVPRHLREAMEELGGAYLKLGQLLSIRPDLVPEEYCKEFEKLLDRVEPEEYSTVVETIEAEFGKPVGDLYAHIDPVPLGSASVAQVHKARLKDGKAVVVKVQRPDVAEQFSADIDILRILANKLQKRLKDDIDPMLIVDEFERYTKDELDFRHEAESIDTLHAALRTEKKIRIPKTYWTLTTKRVLTMDYLEGKRLSDMQRIPHKDAVAKHFIDCVITQVFEKGVFHADLHPGNILIMPNGTLGLLDFGIVGKIDARTRKLGTQLYTAIVNKDVDKIVSILLTYGKAHSTTNVNAFSSEAHRLVYRWYDKDDKRVTNLMHRLFILCQHYHIDLPTDTVLLGKALVTAEATTHYLDPHFDFVKYSRKKVISLLKKQYTPQKLIDRFSRRSMQFTHALAALPEQTLSIVESASKGELSIGIKDDQFRHMGKDINLSSNRLSFSLISAALIITSGYMLNTGPKIAGVSAVSIACLSVASLFIIALFVSIAREGKTPFDVHRA